MSYLVCSEQKKSFGFKINSQILFLPPHWCKVKKTPQTICVYIYMHVHMGVSPYLCVPKNRFISLQKYLHLSPMKHILLIEKYCRKQFWNCHLRLTCKIKQRERKEIITHSSRQTSAWFISVLMNATACDCTLRHRESQLGVDVSVTQNEHWECLLHAYKSPPPAAPLLLQTWMRDSGERGMSCQTASSGHAALPCS